MRKRILTARVARIASPRRSDLGTNELVSKVPSVVQTTSDNRQQRRLLVQVPLDYYLHLSKGGINQKQWQAGNQLFEDFTHAGLIPSPTPMLGNTITSSGRAPGSAADRQQDAYDSFSKALKYFGPTNISSIILLNVCCYGYYLKDLRIPNYANTNQLMCRFKESLDELANYYSNSRR